MEIDEVAARVARSYWPLLLLMTVLPMLLVAFAMSGQEPPYEAKARLQASSKATDAAAGDAGVSIVLSQVKAFATSRNLLEGVAREQRVNTTPEKLAKQISAAGLGTSTVVELSVKDADPQVARKLTDAIGAAVVKEINESNNGAITRQIQEIENRIRSLERKLGPLSRRAGAVPNPDIAAGNERERVQSELTDLRAGRSELRTQLSTSGTASVVQSAALAPRSNPLMTMSIIAGLVGLIGGILIATVTEIARPTIPGQRRVAKRLDAPMLGWADHTDFERADLGRRIRLAAKRAGVTRVALIAAGKGPLPAEMVSKVAAAVYGDETKTVSVGRPPPPAARRARGAAAFKDADEADEEAMRAMANGRVREADPGSGDVPFGTSVVPVSAGGAVRSRQSAEVALPAPAETPKPAPAPAAARIQCHVHAFEDIDPGSDDEVGVVAVVGPVTLLRDLESVRDLATASGWPVLGVAATIKRIKR